MPAPTTADELLDLLQKSNLVDEPRLKAYVQKLRDATTFPPDPNRLAQFLVRDALLSYFQAEQLLQGKYKRFTLGKYKVLEKLGSGGMGTVFLCEHKLMRRRVAVKVLPVPKSEDRASLDRFYREARAIAAVDHPNIVRAYDIDQDDNLHFLVMEWVDGTNLQDLVKKFGPLDPVRACHYIYGAAVGLQHAHEIGIIHRDIKPGNILIDRSGVVKILDLGLARLTNDLDDNLTRQNDENVLGTADYLAPEQAMDSHTVDIRADIYALGATFYFLLTGSPPFPEGSVAQKLIWHQNRPPRPLKSLRAEVPDGVAAVVEKMMAKDMALRYRTPSEVMAALAGWVATPIPPPAERELPTLSPVVAGGQGGARPSAGPGPASLIGGGARTLPSAGLPTAIITAPAPPPAAPAPAHATAAANSPAVWATLGSETQSGAAGDTQKPEPAGEPDAERPSRVRRRTQTRGGGKGKVILFAVGGAALLALVGAGVYFAFFNKKDGDAGAGGTGAATGRRIIVSKAGENTVRTLRQALDKAAAGDTIVIADERIVEPALKLKPDKHKDVTVESGLPDGRPVVIEFFGTKGEAMLDVPSVENFRLKNVELDGKGQVERGIKMSGIAPGTTFEGVTVRNVTLSGFYLQNVAGDAARPVALDRVRLVLAPANESGVVSLASGFTDATNKFIVIKNSRFEGPGKAGIRVDGPTLDLEVTNNRFYNLAAAVSFARPGGKASRGTVTNNTVYQAQVGFLFEAPVAAGDRYDLKVALNYFARTPEAMKAQGAVPGFTGEHNLFDTTSGPGNPPLPAEKFAPALPNPNPEEDATFLRFPANTGPTAGPTKARVGAQ